MQPDARTGSAQESPEPPSDGSARDPAHGINLNSSVYYTGRYWNELPQVVERLNEKISGSRGISWEEHFAKVTGRTFQCALILNCGNGWVERGLLKTGLIDKAVGIDCSPSLLDEARQAALNDGLVAEYHEMDVNSTAFPPHPFDLVVNVGAAHHIAYIDKVFRALCKLLPEDGWFVSFDYVGPHRNQYAPATWEAAWELNSALPDSLRQDLRYPHLPTMLLDDPTEAIHSELVLPTFRRYFEVRECVLLGGALAYPLLTHNDRLFASTDNQLRDTWVDRILVADEAYLVAEADTSLFAYFAGQPDKRVLTRTGELEAWTRDEEDREFAAMTAGGEYYAHTALQTEYLSRTALEARLNELSVQTQELAAQLSAVQRSLAVRLAQRVSRSERAARLVQHPLTQRLLARLRARLED